MEGSVNQCKLDWLVDDQDRAWNSEQYVCMRLSNVVSGIPIHRNTGINMVLNVDACGSGTCDVDMED